MAELSAAQRGKIRRLSQPRELAPDEEGGELNIVPFLDIIVNILIFVLATVVTTFTATIETNPPAGKSAGVRASVPKESLNLTVIIVNDGFSLKASGGNVGSGCTGVGQGISVQNRGGDYDFVGLTKCAAKLKSANPSYADEEQVTITANPGVPYGTVIKTMDALRTTPNGAGPLFPNVNFGLAGQQ
jgi:biopolymer transport protein ExbD